MEIKPERIRVAAVKVIRGSDVHEIRDCWISVQPGSASVRIWLTLEEDAPLLTVPLDQAIIDWPEIEVPMCDAPM